MYRLFSSKGTNQWHWDYQQYKICKNIGDSKSDEPGICVIAVLLTTLERTPNGVEPRAALKNEKEFANDCPCYGCSDHGPAHQIKNSTAKESPVKEQYWQLDGAKSRDLQEYERIMILERCFQFLGQLAVDRIMGSFLLLVQWVATDLALQHGSSI